jgi:hypothetical protein
MGPSDGADPAGTDAGVPALPASDAEWRCGKVRHQWRRSQTAGVPGPRYRAGPATQAEGERLGAVEWDV